MGNWEAEREGMQWATEMCACDINRNQRELDRVQMRNFCPLFIDLMAEVLVDLLFYLLLSHSLSFSCTCPTHVMSLCCTHFIGRWMLISTHFVAFLHRFDLRRVFINFKNEKCAYKWKQIECTQMAGPKPTTKRTNEWTNRKKKLLWKCICIAIFFFKMHANVGSHL